MQIRLYSIISFVLVFISFGINAQPVITSFTPTSAKPGDAVTITGTNFNTTAANNIVFFGATRATVNTASTTQLTVTVPTGATFAPITILNTGNSLACASRTNFNPVFSPSKSNIGASDFSPKQDFASGPSPYNVAIGDLDGDGKPDLVISNSGSNYISIFRNTSTSGSIGSGSFAAKQDFTTGNGPRTIAIGDLDGDGKPDLAVVNSISNSVSILRNTSTSGSIGSGSFAAKQDFATGVQPYSLAIRDLDGDGKPDLAVGNRVSATISVLRNTSTSGSIGSGSFAAKQDFTTNGLPLSVAIGDLDGDGKPDLAVANQSGGVSVFRNTSTIGSIGSSSFSAKQDFSTGNNSVSVAIGDLDGDGKPDLTVVNAASNTISVLRNISTSGSIGSSSFAAKQDFATGSEPFSVAIGDLDGNGKPDLAVANFSSNTVSVFRNTSTIASIGSSSFAAKQDFSVGSQPFSVAIGDLDGDGMPDLASANFGSFNLSLLRNADASSLITVTSSLSAFSTCVGTASAEQSFSASGNNLTANITITAPAGFEVSTTSGSGFGSSVTLTQSGGSVNSTTIYVRVSNSATGTPSGNITIESTGATTQNVAVSGTVNALPTISLGTINSVISTSTSFIIPYSATTGSPDQYSISVSSPTGMSGFSAVNNASLAASPISVSIPASAAGTYNFGLVVRNSTTGCVSDSSLFSLTVNPAIAINVSGTLAAVNTIYGAASATPTSFSINGIGLTEGITITPPSGYEVSTSLSSGYTNSLLLSLTSGEVAATTIYVRLSATATVAGSPYSGNIVCSSTGATTQNVATVSSTVSTRDLTITANNINKTYGATLSSATGSTAFTSSGLQNSETIGSVSLAFGTGSAATAAVGTYTGSVTPSAATGGTFTASNYNITYTAGNIIVGQAALTITANNANKTYGATLSSATGSTAFTSSGLQNSETIGSISLAFGTGSAATAAVGTYTGSVTPSAATGGTFTASNYNITYTTGNIIVGQAALAITANNASKTYGAAASLSNFTATGLVNSDAVSAVSLSSTGSPATAAVGTYPITASNATGTGLANYTITYNNGTLTVNPAALTITANNSNKTYGATASLSQFTATGLVNSDAVSAVALSSTGSAATAAVGTYPITAASAIGTGLANYTITYNNGTLTVNPAALTITANNANKTYGATASLSNFTATGLVNSDAVSAVTLSSTGSPATAAVGTYTITASNATGTGLGNYTITYNNGTLTVNQAALTITANNASKTYGATASLSQFTATGLLNSDAVSAVNLGSTGSPATASVGTYPITASNATGTGLANYTITYNNGTMTVLPISLTITAANQTKCQGVAFNIPSDAWGVNGLVNGDRVNSVNLFSVGAGIGAAAGTYNIVPSGATGVGLSNYTITYINGTFTVNALPAVTASASSSSVSRGRNVTLTATGTGSFAWSPSFGLVSPNAAVTEARVIESSTYRVTLTGLNGCRNSASVTVESIEDLFVEPSIIFTPNGDGINDRFVIKNIDVYPQNRLQVYDRAGRLLYEQNNYSNNWDGIVNGKPLQKDNYFYVLTVNNKIVKRGTLTLIR